MAPLVKRRLTPVNYARELINAILAIRQQKQIPNFERISRFLQRNTEITSRKCKEHLNNAVSDGLIVEYTAVGVKGQRTGLEQEGYRVPQAGELMIEDYGHDCYCFECHGPGDVCECSSCFRVYHPSCTKEDTMSESFTCGVCKASRQKTKMKKKMLNTLLSYTILRLKEKIRELQRIGPKATADDFKRFVYRKMDLHKMEQKVQNSRYRSLEEFYADACTILHNCTLLFGETGLTELAVVMVRDCRYDLDEIELCPNCYYMSNAKPEDWFSQPCNPPHDIVYAKQKGYSYWPAKVVKDLGGKFDVRFFGGWHQRAVIPAEYIKPINTDLKTMSIKKTGGFQKSMKELQRYQEILEERQADLEAADAEKEDEEEEEEDEGDDDYDDDEEEEPEEKQLIDDEGGNDENEEEEESRICKEEDVTLEDDLDIKKEETPKKPVKRKDSAQSGSKRAVKRPKVETEGEHELEDEVENRKVTSTSVEKHAKKRMKIASKTNSHDESYTVTSSVDKIGISLNVPTVSTAVQTVDLETENSSTQTDLLETGSASDQPTQEMVQQQRLQDDKMWEERMTTALANLTKRLEEKFEEDKNLALKELSQQLEEDFGKDKQQAVERTIASMKQEFEKARKAGEDKAKEQYMEEMKKLATKHKEAISQVKKKQWCQYCEEEAMYHCCWNTSYCSVKCQQEHWHKEHKRVCRRKRT